MSRDDRKSGEKIGAAVVKGTCDMASRRSLARLSINGRAANERYDEEFIRVRVINGTCCDVRVMTVGRGREGQITDGTDGTDGADGVLGQMEGGWGNRRIQQGGRNEREKEDLGKGRRPEEALGGGQSEQPTSRMPEIGDWRLEVGRPGRLINQRRAQSCSPPG